MRDNADPETDTEPLRRRIEPGFPRKIDRYELQDADRARGMGAVYRAIDTKLGRMVALKTATGKRAGARLTDWVRQRFLREAMALSKVEHRNVVQVLDFGFADDGTPFLVMEHLHGRDLGALLSASERPLPITDVVDIMLGVCAALRACHRAGIIHRDLKPGNIFLAQTDTGREVKVLDFGVSKAPTADDLTREGQILGTPQYLAPEQIDGKVGPASDQYALGVLLYVCLTLRLPYEDHQNRALLRAIEAGRFAAPHTFRPDLPEELEAIVLRAMHVSPSERFESVYALGQRLWYLASPRSQEEWRSYYRPTQRAHEPGAAGPAACWLGRRSWRIAASSVGERRRHVPSADKSRSREHADRFSYAGRADDPEGTTRESSAGAGAPARSRDSSRAAGAGMDRFAARVGTSRRDPPGARPVLGTASGAAAPSIQVSPVAVASPPPRPYRHRPLPPRRNRPTPPKRRRAPPRHRRAAPKRHRAPPKRRGAPSQRRASRRRCAVPVRFDGDTHLSERVLPNIDQAGIGIPSD